MLNPALHNSFYFLEINLEIDFYFQIPPVFRQEPIEVQINAKSIPADETTWKGAAILSCLGSAQDLWIGPTEWSKFGQKLLREKAPFPWA